MEYRNLTPFPSLAFEGADQYEQEFHVAVLRMTMDICTDNSLSFTEQQTPLCFADEYYGEMNKSSVKQESDLAPYKPACDIMVIGSAHAPGGKPVPRFEAGIRISGSVTLDKKLTITGPRFWEKSATGWISTAPEPIASLLLQYEYAYGGECRINQNDPAATRVEEKHQLTNEQRDEHPDGPEQAPIAHTVYEKNPVGKGFTEQWYLDATKPATVQAVDSVGMLEEASGLLGITQPPEAVLQVYKIPAPQIESPDDPILEFGKQYTPQGFGVITKAWLPRRELFGTIDKKFIDSEAWLPEDYDYAYWNGAHPDMQIPFPKGNETIELLNIGGDRLKFNLPGHKLFALVRMEDGRMFPVDYKLDTLTINTDEKKLSLVYRLTLPKDSGIRVLEARMMDKKEAEELDSLINAIKAEANHG